MAALRIVRADGITWAVGLVSAAWVVSVGSAEVLASPGLKVPSFTRLGGIDVGWDYLGGGDNFPLAVSADGSTVAGAANGEVFRWTAEEGMVGIGGHIQCGVDSPAPYGLSADGSTIVGTQGDCAIRWTAADGWSALSSGARPVAHGACARAASADGSVVVGYHWQECPVPIICFDLIRAASRWPVGGFNLGGGWALGVSADGSTVVGFGCSEAFGCQAVRWTAGEEMIGLGTLPGDDAGTAHDITADGSVVVGETGVLDILVSRVSHPSAVRWTADEGTVALGDLPGVPYTRALGVSEEGQRIVGEGWVEDDFSRYSDAAFVWDPENGMRRLEDVLTQDYSLDLKGFTLMGATGISDDGSVIVGYGRDGEGPLEGWVVPEPGESLLFVTGSLVLLGAARRRA